MMLSWALNIEKIATSTIENTNKRPSDTIGAMYQSGVKSKPKLIMVCNPDKQTKVRKRFLLTSMRLFTKTFSLSDGSDINIMAYFHEFDNTDMQPIMKIAKTMKSISCSTCPLLLDKYTTT